MEIQIFSTMSKMPGNNGRQNTYHDMPSPNSTREMDKIIEGDRGLAQRGEYGQNYMGKAARITQNVEHTTYNVTRF